MLVETSALKPMNPACSLEKLKEHGRKLHKSLYKRWRSERMNTRTHPRRKHAWSQHARGNPPYGSNAGHENVHKTTFVLSYRANRLLHKQPKPATLNQSKKHTHITRGYRHKHTHSNLCCGNRKLLSRDWSLWYLRHTPLDDHHKTNPNGRFSYPN